MAATRGVLWLAVLTTPPAAVAERGGGDPVFPTVGSNLMKAVEERGDETKDPLEDGSERAPDEHCGVSLARDPECSDAIAALLDVKAFTGRLVGGIEGPTMLNKVPANREAWMIGSGPSARTGSLLDLGLFFEKKCVTATGVSSDVDAKFSDSDHALDCLWISDPHTLTTSARMSIEDITCADQVPDAASSGSGALPPHCKEASGRLKEQNGGKNGKGEDMIDRLKNTLKLPMAYRWLQNVVNTMRGDSVEAVPYARTCYTKMLLLNPETWPMMPTTRRLPSGNSRRAPSLLYFRDAQHNCRRFIPQGSAKEAYDRIVAMPERHFLEWGEELPDNVEHPSYQYQTTWPNNPTHGPSGAGRPSDTVAATGVNGGVAGLSAGLSKQLENADASMRGGKPAAPEKVPGMDVDSARANYPGVEKLPLYLPRKRCEICVTVMMRKIAQVPFLCHGLEFYFETCNDVLASILHWYPNVVYWSYTGGCKRQLATGEVFVRPCPPHAICSWLSSPNYNMPFCPHRGAYDNQYLAPGLEDSLQQDTGYDTPSDGLPPQGGAMGSPVVPGFGLVGQQSGHQ